MPITQVTTPLRMIFWGGLLCVFDLSFSNTRSINGQAATGFSFDILNDFVGMLLITVAISKLARFAAHESELSALRDDAFRLPMVFVFVCAILNWIEAFVGHFIFPAPIFWHALLHLLSLASLVAVVLFCGLMCQLSRELGLLRSANSWLTTRLLVIILWVIPLGLIDLASLLSLVTGSSFQWQIGFLIVPVLTIFAIPLVHLFVSTSRMRHEAETVGERDLADLKEL